MNRSIAYTPFVEVGSGVRLFVEDSCSGPLGTLVFIPGWPVGSKIYEYQFQHLVPRGYRCIGLDMRGFGNSDKPWGEYSYDVFAQDIRKVLEALDLSNVTLIGHSMGGAIALRYVASQNAARVNKLVLVCPAAPSFVQRLDFPFGVERNILDRMIQDCLTDRVKMLAKFGEAFFAKPISPAFSRYLHGLALTASPYATIRCLELLRDSDLRDDMQHVKVPTLIIHGKQDAITPFSLAEQLKKRISTSQLLAFEDSGHGVFYEEMTAFNEQLMRFVEA